MAEFESCLLLPMNKMSIIDRDNPLNLQYCVCIVTKASSPLGIRICKTLLKANALVLGVDITAPPREVLNTAQGTHFQFEQWGDIDGDRIVDAAKEKFATNRLDLLVNLAVIEDDFGMTTRHSAKLAEVAFRSMAQQGTGSVVSIAEDLEAEQVDAYLRDFTSWVLQEQPNHSGIRCNMIFPQATGGEDVESASSFEEAKQYMNGLRESKEEVSRAHEIGLLVGWLASDMSRHISGRILRLDGSSSPLGD